MDKWDVELTDTFAGEANYSWVKRATIEMREIEPDNIYTSAATVVKKRNAYRRELIRKAKAEMGLTGVRGRMHYFGDFYEFRPYKTCIVMFVRFNYS